MNAPHSFARWHEIFESFVLIDSVVYLDGRFGSMRFWHMSELTVQYLVLEPCDLARNMARFYVLTIEPPLFGDTALLREWGRHAHSEEQHAKVDLVARISGRQAGLMRQVRYPEPACGNNSAQLH